MADIDATRAEIAAPRTHPTTTNQYSLQDDDVTLAELKAVNRPGNVPIQEIMDFLLLDNTYKSENASPALDTQDRSLWLRIKDVAEITPWNTGAVANPWGGNAADTITEIQGIKTRQLYELFVLSASGNLTVDMANANFRVYLAGAQACQCMSTDQETAFLALADNRQSRETEISLGNLLLGDIAEAR